MEKKNVIRIVSLAIIAFFVTNMLLGTEDIIPDLSETAKVAIIIFLGYIFIIFYEMVYMHYKKKIRVKN